MRKLAFKYLEEHYEWEWARNTGHHWLMWLFTNEIIMSWKEIERIEK